MEHFLVEKRLITRLEGFALFHEPFLNICVLESGQVHSFFSLCRMLSKFSCFPLSNV